MKQPTLDDAANILRDEDKDALVQLLLDWARDDELLHERVIQYAARRLGPESSIAAARRAFDSAVLVHGFVPYRQAPAWARGVDEAIGNISRLLDDGHAAAVIELTEYALGKVVKTLGSVDDSADGCLGMLRDRLQDIHYRACQQAQPDPVALARRLLDWELHSELDVFYGAAERYATILGASGLSEYRRLAEVEWGKVPAKTAKDSGSAWSKHLRITHVMESLARASGDIEKLVAIKSRDLSHSYDYLQIAEVYRDAGLHDNALIWAERGLKAFPKGADTRLREFAAEEYHRRRRHRDATELMWTEFLERPFMQTYQTLQRHATKSGDWAEWRERALAEIRSRIAVDKRQAHAPTSSRWTRPTVDHSLLVEIYVYERDVETAWREAQEGGCSAHLWLQLAAKREKDHPEDAAPIYWKQAEAAVSNEHSGRYEHAVDLLIKAAALMKRIGRNAEFVSSLEALRTKYKIKRNFIKLVEQKRKSLYLT